MYIQKFQQKNNKGFTLVEVLVSVTLFTVVAVVGITAVIISKSAYEKNQSIKATNDSLMFIMEDISRTARLGNVFRCINISGTPSVDLESIEEPSDGFPGQDCEGFSFEPFWNPALGDPEDQIIYVFAATENTDGETVGALFARSIADDTAGGTIVVDEQHFQRITPTNLDIDLSKSGFDVIGSEDVTSQPRVIIRITGTITERNQETKLSLQTTISQRAISID